MTAKALERATTWARAWTPSPNGIHKMHEIGIWRMRRLAIVAAVVCGIGIMMTGKNPFRRGRQSAFVLAPLVDGRMTSGRLRYRVQNTRNIRGELADDFCG